MTYLQKFAAACLAIVVAFVAQPAFAAGQRILLSDDSVEMQLGDLTSVTLTLDAPIICADQTVICDVVIDFGSSFPQGVDISPTSVSWAANEWFQARTINLAIDSNAESLIGQTVTLTGAVTTNTSYYAGLTPTISLTVPANSTPPIAYETRVLAATGSNDYLLLGAGLLLIGAGASIIRVRNKGARK